MELEVKLEVQMEIGMKQVAKTEVRLGLVILLLLAEVVEGLLIRQVQVHVVPIPAALGVAEVEPVALGEIQLVGVLVTSLVRATIMLNLMPLLQTLFHT